MKYRNVWIVMVLSFFLFDFASLQAAEAGHNRVLVVDQREAVHTAPFSLPLMRFQQTINNRQRSILKMAYIKKNFASAK